MKKNVFITTAKYLDEYRIAFRFTDGHDSEVDFHGFLTAPAQNPMVTQFLDVTRFKNFRVEDRTDIVWGDWEMCFPFASLYAGDLSVDSLGKKRASRKGLVRSRQIVSGSTPAPRPPKKTVSKRPGRKVPKA